jgi:hypothetical protein
MDKQKVDLVAAIYQRAAVDSPTLWGYSVIDLVADQTTGMGMRLSIEEIRSLVAQAKAEGRIPKSLK